MFAATYFVLPKQACRLFAGVGRFFVSEVIEDADFHCPVMGKELLEALQIKPDGCYLDATYGRGGHSQAVLERLGTSGRLLAFDKDPQACQHAQKRFGGDARFEAQQASFACIAELVADGPRFDGAFFDLGVSTPQLNDAQRGFSFQKNGPLDMRMDCSRGYPVSEWLAGASSAEISRVLRQYGEEPRARQIARAIKRGPPPRTTLGLAKLLAKVAQGSAMKKHPATRVFLALRMFINRELEDLQEALEAVLYLLKTGGKLVVIAFHSLEDRIVKEFLRTHGTRFNPGHRNVATKKASANPANKTLQWDGRCLFASHEEVAANPRARSARLRVAEKVLQVRGG